LNILHTWLENAYSRPPKLRFLGFDPLNGEIYQKNPPVIPAHSQKIQDILQDIWEKNTGHFTGLQKSILLHLLGITVSQQYSISSDVGGQ